MFWLITVVLSLIMMLGYFLMLWSAVGFIQNKKFFSSAPKDIQKVVMPKEERFKGQHVLGYIMLVLSFCLLIGPVVYGVYDGIRNEFSYWMFFVRQIIMLVSLEIFDIIFFDMVLLCHSNFFPHYYPETKEYAKPYQFGFNKWAHVIHILIFIVGSFVIALIGTLL